MDRPLDLPEFDRPPVDEVVVGVYFRPLERYSDVHTMLLWQELRDRYPRVETQGRLEIVEDPLGMPPVPQPPFRFSQVPSGSRTWLVSEDDEFLVQIQDNMLLTNWRFRQMPYPRFETLLERFHSAFAAFTTMTREQHLPPIEVTLADVTYINWIEDLPLRSFFLPAAMVNVGGRYIDSEPEAQGWGSKYLLRRTSGEPYGRLTIDCSSAYRLRDNVPVAGSSLQLACRFPGVEDYPVDQLDELFADGRNAIVQTFTELTTEDAHEHWGRQK